MNESKKTLAYVTTALVLVALAWALTPHSGGNSASGDQGQPFFADFTDPNAATSIEIVSYDPSTGSATPFKVEFKDDRWIIPSHHNYPADARDRLAKTAAGVIDIKRDEFRSDNVADYGQFGVIDPLDDKQPGLAGRGTHVTLKGAGDKLLADFIVGNPVPGKAGFRFVRVPSEQRVYAARMNVDLSANFDDWINRDLLEIVRTDVTRIAVNDYSVNERTGSMDTRDNFTLECKDGKWSCNKQGSSQALDSAKILQLVANLDELKIVGVRPKPVGLVKALQGDPSAQVSQPELMSLQQKGFYITRTGQLLANDGEMAIYLKDGVFFLLRFGEIMYGSGAAVTAGESDSSGAKAAGGTSTNRYLFITAQFDSKSVKEPKRPSGEAWRTTPDSLMTPAEKQDKELGLEHDRWMRQTSTAKQRADELNARFSNWYYVIPEESYEKIKVKRADLVTKGASSTK